MNIPIKKPEAKQLKILFAVLVAFAILLVPSGTLSAGDRIRSDLSTGDSDDGSLNINIAKTVTADTIGVGKIDTGIAFVVDKGGSEVGSEFASEVNKSSGQTFETDLTPDRSGLDPGIMENGSLNSDAANLATADTADGGDIDTGVGVGEIDTDIVFEGDKGISDIECVANGLPAGNADVSAAVDAVVTSVAEESDIGIPEVASEIASDLNNSSGQTFETDLTPGVVVGTNTNHSFTLTIEEVGSSDIAEVAIIGNDFNFVSLDNVTSTDGFWSGSIDSINNILHLLGTVLQAGQSVTAEFTATTPNTAGIYNFDVDVTNSGGISNSPQIAGVDDQPSVWVAGVSHNVTPADSIQSAIDAAQPYDIIDVQPGSYEENLVINDSTGLLLRSTVKHGAIIDGVNFGRGVTLLEFKPTDDYTISDIRIEGFTFKDIPIPSVGAASTGHGIAMFTDKIIANITIVDNLFDNTNPLTTENHKGAAILIDNVDGLLIENNTMLDTALYGTASPEEVAAITLHQFFDSNYLSDVVVKNNNIINATRGIWVGEGLPNSNRYFNNVFIEGNYIEQIAREGIRADVGATAGNETLIIRNNQFVDADRTIRIGALGSGGIVIVDSNNVTTTAGSSDYGIRVQNGQIVIMDNTISGQETGVLVDAGLLITPVIQGNIFTSNTLQVNDNSGSLNLDNTLIANIFDRAAVVRDSNTNDIKVPIIFSSIQDAVDQAIAGDTVNVHPGTYDGYLVITKDDLRIQSTAGRNETFITGTHDRFPGYAEVVLVGISGDRVVFEGFTLQGTYTAGHDYTVSVYGDEVQILNNEIIGDPSSPLLDVGIQVWRGSDGANLEGNIIRNMSHSGISVGGGTLATNVRIHRNEVYDTERDYGIAIDRAPGSIVTENIVEGAGRAGIYVVNRVGRSVAGTIVADNTVQNNYYGIRIRDGGAPVEGVEFSGNTITGNQIGIYLEGDDISGATAQLNSIVGNIQYGIQNASPSIFNARNNWWGDLSGPNTHPADFTPPDGYVLDPETLEPADGTGDAVSVNVLFDPWLDSEPTPPLPPTPDPGFRIGLRITGLSQFMFFEPAVRSLVFGADPVVTVQFVLTGTFIEHSEAIAVYERYRQAFENNKDNLEEKQYAVAIIELTVARAAIEALEASLRSGSGVYINLDAVVEAYNEAVKTFNQYGHHLTEVQINIVKMILSATAKVIAVLSA